MSADPITRLNAALEGRYRIESALGEGGMATVYLADDLKHERKVALKVLKPELAAVVGADRFLAEIKTTANLTHPHILPLHDSGEADGFLFYVMPHVEGESLRSRLDREHQLPVEDAVSIATNIAEALDYAHRQGVIHRDIKPANVLLLDGKPVISDFGIALAVGTAGRGRMTETGLSMGTPHYMSPEQATGDQNVGPATDIYALGCVLYEMLVGEPPFTGSTPQAVLGKIITREAPDAARERRTVPGAINSVIKKALEKLPADRFEDARAFSEALADPHYSLPASAGPSPLPAAMRNPKRLVSLIVAAFVLGGVFGGGWIRWSTDPAPSPIRQERLTELVGMEETPAISPDGTYLAFAARVDGRQQVFRKLVEEGEPEQLTDGDFDYSFPRWVDENTLIYFRHPGEEGDRGSLWEQLVIGSTTPRSLGEADGEAAVSHSGQMIATFRGDRVTPELALIERGDAGLREARVISLPGGEYTSPRWSWDDRYVAFQVRSDISTSAIQVVDVLGEGGPETKARAAQIRGIAWLTDDSGWVYSSSEGSTLAYPPIFSLRTVEMADSLSDVELPLGQAGSTSYVEPDIAADGTLVASRIHLDSDIYRFSVDGSPQENVENAERITFQNGQVQTPSASPDGDEVVYLSDRGGHANVWVSRVDGTETRQLTREQDPSVTIGITLWSPTDDVIVYFRKREGAPSEERLVNSDGNEDRPLVSDMVGGASWSADGKWVYYISSGAMAMGAPESCTEKINIETRERIPVRCGVLGLAVTSDGRTGYFNPSNARQGEVWTATPIETGEMRLLRGALESRIPLWPHQYALSPDGRWLATPLRDQGTTNLWLISTADATLHQITDFQQRSTTIGRQVAWSSDGRHILAALLETDADIVLLGGRRW